MAGWYYAKNGQQQGPVDIATLQRMTATGELSPSDLVWREGLAQWVPASQAGELFPQATSPAAPAQVAVMPPAQTATMPMPPAPMAVNYASPGMGTVPNYLVQAILVTVFCCLPFGIAAIVYAAQVNTKLQIGDYQGAVEASNKAKFWSWLAFGIGLGASVLWFLVGIIGAAAGA